MKIINKNLNNSYISKNNKNIKTINLNPKLQNVNKIKYLPAFSKEWKNIIYSFNKNNLRNLGSNTVNINKIIKGYFNLYFKNHRYLGKTKFRHLRKRRDFLRRIYISNADIKYTSNKAKIILYVLNKEQVALKRKYLKLKKKIKFNLLDKTSKYFNDIKKETSLSIKNFDENKVEYVLVSSHISKKKFIKHKLKCTQKFISLSQLLLKKTCSILFKNQSIKFLMYLRKYDLLYSLNTNKFTKSKLLSKLTYLLQKIIGKKLEYTIINLKSMTYHPDILTYMLGLKIKKDKMSVKKRLESMIHQTEILKNNKIEERVQMQKSDKLDTVKNALKDSKVISHINENRSLSDFLKNTNNNKKNILSFIFNSINYKNLGGIRLKVSGRLTKRYRADRAIRMLNWKGALKNIDSSFTGLNTVTFRGNTHSNISYSFFKSKRRVGSFAVKGWIAGK